jgi:hypothetical protein
MRVLCLLKATVEEIPDEEAMPKTLPDAEPIGPQDYSEELIQPTSPPPTKKSPLYQQKKNPPWKKSQMTNCLSHTFEENL